MSRRDRKYQTPMSNPPEVTGIQSVSFGHGGNIVSGFWIDGRLKVYTPDRNLTIELSLNDAEDLEATILEWLDKKGLSE